MPFIYGATGPEALVEAALAWVLSGFKASAARRQNEPRLFLYEA